MTMSSAIFKLPPRFGTVLALAAAALIAAPLAARAQAVKAAVFPFELDDTSLMAGPGGPSAAAQARLQLIDGETRDLLTKTGHYDVVPLGAVADKAKAGQDLRTCDGCEVPLAREVGADVSVIGWVQKVSNLILNINLVIRDVKTGKILEEGSVDIRGDTDESWTRGVAYLIHDRLKLDAPGSPK